MAAPAGMGILVATAIVASVAITAYNIERAAKHAREIRRLARAQRLHEVQRLTEKHASEVELSEAAVGQAASYLPTIATAAVVATLAFVLAPPRRA